MTADSGPDERCGFVLEPEDVPGDMADSYRAGSEAWYEYSEAVCCWREVWDGSKDGRCVWHANAEDKPTDVLVEARAEGPERLDGAYIPDIMLREAIDFEGCGLQAVTFEGTKLRNISFANVDGRFALFRDTDLPFVQFSDANFRDARFPNAYLRHAQFPDADLRTARFPEADLRGTSFEGAYMNLGAIVRDNAEFDGGTDFGRSHLEKFPIFGGWGQAAREYRSFQQTLREHALPGQVRKCRIYEMHARRRAARVSGDRLT